jgi:hypothetical protein
MIKFNAAVCGSLLELHDSPPKATRLFQYESSITGYFYYTSFFWELGSDSCIQLYQ